MPAKFHPVTPAIWDRTMRELSPEAKLVRLYLLTCANRLSEGLYQLAIGIVAHDTGLSPDAVVEALGELESVALASYDRDAEVVLDRTALRYAPLRNGTDREGNVKRDNRIAGAIRHIENVPDTPLKEAQYRLARDLSPALREAMDERFPELRYGSTDSRTVAEPSPLPGALSLSQGATPMDQAPRRAEPIREEQRRAESIDTPFPEDALILCAHCSESAMMMRPGEPKLYNGDPYCGWCVGTLV